jgi:hypothetical protein
MLLPETKKFRKGSYFFFYNYPVVGIKTVEVLSRRRVLPSSFNMTVKKNTKIARLAISNVCIYLFYVINYIDMPFFTTFYWNS